MKSFKIILAAFSLIVVLSGCYKAGCTDPDATNYDPEMKTEDLSCTYTGNLVFWAKATTRDSLINLGHTMLRFELEDLLVDSMATSGFNANSGECNSSTSKTIVRNFDGNTERSYKYRVKGLGFQTIYEGFVTVKANRCEEVHLY